MIIKNFKTNIMVEIIIGLIIALFVWLFLYLPVMGIAYLFLEEFALGLLYLLPFLGLIGFILYRQYVIEPEHERKVALSRWYKYPLHLGKKVNYDQWHRGFKAVIHNGLVSTTDSNKQNDLNHCQKIVEKMTKDDVFNDLHRAFQLTGCHMEIKDATGHTITKIV